MAWGDQAGALAGAHGKVGVENQLLLEQMSLCLALGLASMYALLTRTV